MRDSPIVDVPAPQSLTDTPRPPVSLRAEVRQLGDVVYTRLLELIVSHQIAPGARLVQEDLATEFGVSRMPVRDALHRLHIEGLVVGSVTAGYTARLISERDVRETSEIRIAMDLFAAELVIERASDADIQGLAGVAHAQREATLAGLHRQEQIDRSVEWNTAFIALTGNLHMIREYGRFVQVVDVYVLRDLLPRKELIAEQDDWLNRTLGVVETLILRDLPQAQDKLRERRLFARGRTLAILRQFDLLSEPIAG